MPGVATNTQFADKLLDMVERHGLRWTDIGRVHGDNPVRSRWGMKSNIETMRAIANRLGVSPRALRPRILKAKDGTASAGTVSTGCRYPSMFGDYRRAANVGLRPETPCEGPHRRDALCAKALDIPLRHQQGAVAARGIICTWSQM
jgi:hypothetical protein